MGIKRLCISAAMIVFALSVTGCSDSGDGGGGPAPAPATGFSKGVITAKGSVTINGVKYDSSKPGIVKFENISGLNDDQLKVGMVVKIKGMIDDVTKTGTASKIEYADNLEGMVDAISAVNNTVTVLGQIVTVDNNTVLEGFTGLADGSLLVGDRVEVSGFPDTAGGILATRIEKKTGVAEDFEIKGTVSGLAAGTFTLTPPNSGTPLTVNFTGTLPSGIANGSFVEVKVAATDFNSATNTITTTAAKIESEDELEADDHDRVEVEGFVTSVDSANKTFVVNGITVDASGLTVIPAVGQKVEVEGTMVNGILVPAKECKVEQESNIKVEADVVAITGNSITVLVAGMTGIVTSTTLFKDESSAELENFGLADLMVGDHVEAVATDNPADPNTVLLTKVVRKKPSDVIVLQTLVDSKPPQTVTNTFRLGPITVDIATTPANEIKDINGVPFTTPAQDNFLNALIPDKTIVKAKGTKTGFNSSTKTLVATEVEIEEQSS